MATIEQTHRTSLRNLKNSYILAFSVIALILISTLLLNRVALNRESVSRGAAALVSRQSIRSQRIARDSILLLVPGDHTATVSEINNDITSYQQDRAVFLAQYSGYYPQIATIDGGHGHATAVYYIVLNTAKDEVRIEHETPDQQKRDQKQFDTDEETIFYKEQEQLNNIQATQSIIDADTNGYISNIGIIDNISFLVTSIALLYEALFILRPSFRYFSQAITPKKEPEEVSPTV